MRLLLGLIGIALVAVAAIAASAVWDLGWNGGAMLSRLAGRDALVQACTSPLRRELTQRGFTPVDITFGDMSGFSVTSGTFGRARSLASSFTFTDGQQGPRVDGRLVCTLEGSAASVALEVDELPRRVT
jgi:hypothetical protein